MGWGTHEDKHPEGGKSQGTAAYLMQPGCTTLMRSWVPDGGQYNGYCIQHSENIKLLLYYYNYSNSHKILFVNARMCTKSFSKPEYNRFLSKNTKH